MEMTVNFSSRSSQSFNAYLREIRQTKPLSEEQEYELAEQIKAGNTKARNQLVEANQKYVITCANKYCKTGVPMEELVSAGRFGLVIAAERYNPVYGIRFIAYARHYIEANIRQAISEYIYPFHLPYDIMSIPSQSISSANEDIDYKTICDEDIPEKFSAVCQSFEERCNEENRPLIEKVASSPVSESIKTVLKESESDLRIFLSRYYEPYEVNMMMDYAHKIYEGYTIKDLAFEYKLPWKKMSQVINELLDKAQLLQLKKTYSNNVA